MANSSSLNIVNGIDVSEEAARFCLRVDMVLRPVTVFLVTCWNGLSCAEAKICAVILNNFMIPEVGYIFFELLKVGLARTVARAGGTRDNF